VDAAAAAAAEDRVLATGTAFSTNTGRPELWLSVHLTKNSTKATIDLEGACLLT